MFSVPLFYFYLLSNVSEIKRWIKKNQKIWKTLDLKFNNKMRVESTTTQKMLNVIKFQSSMNTEFGWWFGFFISFERVKINGESEKTQRGTCIQSAWHCDAHSYTHSLLLNKTETVLFKLDKIQMNLTKFSLCWFWISQSSMV